MKSKIILAAALSSVSFSSQTIAQTPTHNDVVYGVLGSQAEPRPITLDLYIPTNGTGPFPVIIRIHGGGWSGGTNQPIPALYTALLQQGFAIASPRYRLTSQETQWAPSPVIFPAQINDIKGAVRWLRANVATYNLDPTRFGSCGESAGGHLSALLGTSGGVFLYSRAGATINLEGNVGGNFRWSSRVQAVADYFGPTDLLNMALDVTNPPGSGFDHDDPTSPESRLMGWDEPGQGIADIRANLNNPSQPYPVLAARIISANSITHVDPNDPPYFIAHGAMDTTVPVAQSQRLHDALTAAGVPSEFIINPAGGHSIWPDANEAIVAFFVDRLITNPPTVCLGNADDMPTVDFADMTQVLTRFGLPGGIGQPGDADGNGTVNFADINAVLSNWGTVCP